jgi:polar amino acid transport system permease protein
MSNVETIKVVPARYPLRAVGAAAPVCAGRVIQSVAFNPRWERCLPAGSLTTGDPRRRRQTLLTLIGTALSGRLAWRGAHLMALSSLAWAISGCFARCR